MAGCPLLAALVAVSLLFGVSALNEASEDDQLVEFVPALMDSLVLGKTETIDVQATHHMTGNRRLSCVVVNPDIVELVHGGSVTVCEGLPSNASLPHLTVRGLRMGRTSLECRIDDGVRGRDNVTMWAPLQDKYKIAVIRKPHVLYPFFLGLVFILVLCVNIGMGCALDLEVVKTVLRRPVAPAIGFFSQFLVMPIVSHVSSCRWKW